MTHLAGGHAQTSDPRSRQKSSKKVQKKFKKSSKKSSKKVQLLVSDPTRSHFADLPSGGSKIEGNQDNK